jgi:hypothetical protein
MLLRENISMLLCKLTKRIACVIYVVTYTDK